METLKKLGYHVKSEVLNSMLHGNIPQNRERIFIIATRKHYFDFEKLKKKKKVILEMCIT